MQLLAGADALMSLSGHRRQQVWDASALRSTPSLLRPRLAKQKLRTAAELQDCPNGRLVRYCGLVTLRQQPATANGVIFLSLEDETGVVQVICWRSIKEA